MGCCFSNHVSLREITSAVSARIAGCTTILVVDVRSRDEVARSGGMIPTAVNIPLSELDVALSHQYQSTDNVRFGAKNRSLRSDAFVELYGEPKPDPDRCELIFYGGNGCIAALARRKAQDFGYRNTALFYGGWAEWKTSMTRSL